jgi:hypothetical protein
MYAAASARRVGDEKLSAVSAVLAASSLSVRWEVAAEERTWDSSESSLDRAACIGEMSYPWAMLMLHGSVSR